MASHSCVLSRMETAEYAPREVMASVQPQCIVYAGACTARTQRPCRPVSTDRMAKCGCSMLLRLVHMFGAGGGSTA